MRAPRLRRTCQHGARSMLEVTFVRWVATLALIAALFILDLVVSRPGHAHTVAFREAVVASLFYIGTPDQSI